MSLKIKRGNGAPSVTLLEGEPYLDIDTGDIYIGDGNENQQHEKSSGAGGTYWSIVSSSGTPSENGAALLAEYARVKALGLSLDADTRYTIYIPAGQYDLASEFTVDTAYIDIKSLSGQKEVHLTSETINVTADNIEVVGIDVGTQAFKGCDDLANIVITNCEGTGEESFGGSTASGTFINCEGGDESFGGSSSFGSSRTASGTFIDCTGGDESFGGAGTASGTFINCTGEEFSFGFIGSGTFKNCTSSDASFGGGGIASGTFTNCEGDDQSFGAGNTASGTFTNCKGGDYSFGGDGTASGTFTNCEGYTYSFGGGYGGTASGTFLWCRVTSGSFPSLASGGIQRMCLNADYTEVNADG